MIKYLAALFCCVTCFCRPVYAGTIAVPLPPTTATIPTTVVPTSSCVGVSDAGIAACNAVWRWKGTGRFGQNYQVEVGYLYNVATGAITVLQPLVGDTLVRLQIITPGGRVCGQSSYRLYLFTIVAWDSAGMQTSYGPGQPTDCDDLGRVAQGKQIYDGGWVTVDSTTNGKVFALSNNGDYVLATGGIEHVCLYRASELPAIPEDACNYPALQTLTQYPARVRINSAGVVAWHFTWSTGDPLGFYALPGIAAQTITLAAPWAGLNAAGVAVGGDKMLTDGVLSTITAAPFTAVKAQGINASGVITGYGNLLIGTAQVMRAFVLVP